MDMVTQRCDVSLEDLIEYVTQSRDQEDTESVIHDHLDTACSDCVSKLMELKMILERSWPVIDIHLN